MKSNVLSRSWLYRSVKKSAELVANAFGQNSTQQESLDKRSCSDEDPDCNYENGASDASYGKCQSLKVNSCTLLIQNGLNSTMETLRPGIPSIEMPNTIAPELAKLDQNLMQLYGKVCGDHPLFFNTDNHTICDGVVSKAANLVEPAAGLLLAATTISYIAKRYL